MPARPARAHGPLTILTEEFPPFNYLQDGKLTGISTDILKLILKDSGIEAKDGVFTPEPWARGYNQTLTAPDTLLYSVTRTPEREKLFKWVGPIASNRNVLVARKDKGIHVRTFSDALIYNIGAIRDDAGEQLVLSLGYPKSRLDLATDARSNLLKLRSGRIDLFAYPETVFRWVVKHFGQNPEDYETVFVLHDGFVYFALNKDTPDEVVLKLQNSLDKLRQSGKVQAIIDSYLH